MKKYKLRFNLGKGPHYNKWKLIYPDKSISYFNPEEVNITLFNVKLHNNSKVANQIFNGANKSVCAWLSAEVVYVLESIDLTNIDNEVSFNPRVKPNWVFDGENYDDKIVDRIYSNGKKLFITQYD